MQVEFQVVYKFILLEYPSVGKTAFNINSFNEQYQPTIGVDFHSIKFDLNREQRFISLTSISIKGVVIIGDITNRQFFNDLSKWQEKVKNNTNSYVPKLLIGIKSDLTGKEKSFLKKDSNWPILQVCQTSAKDGINIDQAMKNLLNEALAQYEKYKKEDHSKNQ
ncbi:unnamed protein product [Paramecium primaurelia]|uniref:Uncharacterized protein n=1 Tax=Paramecium primaurelia TaxID=5886 RepID=A0A8S1LNZ7_PARPR|nr:unnamed protein product [Paramecium primaurelia]